MYMKEINKIIEINLKEQNIIMNLINNISYKYNIDYIQLLNDIKLSYINKMEKIGILVLDNSYYEILNEDELEYLNSIKYNDLKVL